MQIEYQSYRCCEVDGEGWVSGNEGLPGDAQEMVTYFHHEHGSREEQGDAHQAGG